MVEKYAPTLPIFSPATPSNPPSPVEKFDYIAVSEASSLVLPSTSTTMASSLNNTPVLIYDVAANDAGRVASMEMPVASSANVSLPVLTPPVPPPPPAPPLSLGTPFSLAAPPIAVHEQQVFQVFNDPEAPLHIAVDPEVPVNIPGFVEPPAKESNDLLLLYNPNRYLLQRFPNGFNCEYTVSECGSKRRCPFYSVRLDLYILHLCQCHWHAPKSKFLPLDLFSYPSYCEFCIPSASNPELNSNGERILFRDCHERYVHGMQRHSNYYLAYCVLCERPHHHLLKNNCFPHKKQYHSKDDDYIDRIPRAWQRVMEAIEADGENFNIYSFVNSRKELGLSVRMAGGLFELPGFERPRRMDKAVRKGEEERPEEEWLTVTGNPFTGQPLPSRAKEKKGGSGKQGHF